MVTNNKNHNNENQQTGRHKPKSLFDYNTTDPHDFTPCPLQIKLYEEAKNQNIIICLENDITKTFISIMLIDYFAFKTKPAIEKERAKKILVIESNESTIDQRINFILNNINLNGLILKKENFSSQRFQDQFKAAELLIGAVDLATQLFKDHLIKIEDFCLIIFNDIHQNFDNENNLKIMNFYEKSNDKPRILSFCISLINNESTTKRMNALINKMETNFHSKCKASVSTYNYKLKEIIIKVQKSPFDLVLDNEFKNVFTLITSLTKFLDKSKIKPKNDCPNINLKDTKKFINTFIYVIEEMGISPAKKLTELYINELSELVTINMPNDKNYASALSALNSLFYYLRSLLNALLKKYSILGQFYKLTSSKLRCLVSTLSENLNESNRQLEALKSDKELRRSKKIQDSQFSCIIFAKKKEIVRVLAAYLQEVSDFDIQDCFNLKVESIVCEKRIVKNFEELKPNKRQEEIISKFKKFELNTLVVTSSFEEKLDIPKCNLVIRFDLPLSSKEYIQSKERTRPENSKLIFIVNVNSNDEEKLSEFVEQEKILMLKFKNNLENEDEDKLKELNVDIKEIEKQMPVFEPEVISSSKKSVRTANTQICIAVINRYCSKLPSDSFTKLFPRWKLNEKLDENGLKLYQCEISLPINSPIRYEIKGDFYLTKKLAKKSAAIKACQKLYECGELDTNFLPICKENIKCIDNEIELIGADQTDANRSLAGTTKKRRYYNKRTSAVLTGPSLNSNEEVYFYVFSMKLTCPIPEEQNTRGRKIIDPADFNLNFGLLIRNKMPKICKFPVFTRSGEVLVDLKYVPKKVQLDDEKLRRLVNFHKFNFKDVLLLEKYPMKFDYLNSNCTYLIVPINYDVKQPDDQLEKADIDWNFIKIVEDYQKNAINLKVCDLTSKNRPKFEFKQELYEDAVIKPLYHKNDQNFYFYVAEIFHDLNPLSPFTNEQYDTFVDYYKTKYSTEITNLTQPLLDVDYTSARLNLLTPRYVNRKGITLPMSTAKTKTEIRNNLEKKQLLIPEICSIHPFPASFWKKAVCLPSILYRVNCLLLAEELRKQVATSVNIGKIELDENESWPSLDFGWTLADVLSNCIDKNKMTTNHSNNEQQPSQNTSTTNNSNKVKQLATTVPSSKVKDDKKSNDKVKANIDKLSFNDFSTTNQNDPPLDDYVIDVFDPSKCQVIENIEEYDSDEEMENEMLQNLMNGERFFNMNTFDLNTSPNITTSNLFDSNAFSIDNKTLPAIENVNPNWIGQDNQFLNFGMDGLMSIEGLDGFNVQSLSRDIAKINQNVDLLEDFDSDENISSGLDDLDDEEDAEFDPKFKPKNSFFSKPSFVQDEFLFEIQTNGLMIENSKASDGNQSELTNICNNLKEEELVQETIVQDINSDYFEIRKFDDKESIKTSEEKEKKFVLKEFTSQLKQMIGTDDSSNKNTTSKAKSSKSNEKKTINTNSTDKENFQPGFGELLPIKKTNKEEKKNATETNELDNLPTFNVKFDPFKVDESDCLGPDPSMILQALTMSNASDGINLERLETVGDSFLKYAVTAYLYCTFDKIHEGKLSHLRSKQISNYNLFRLGKEKCLGEMMVATKFEPSDNWLPPAFVIPKGLEQVLVDLSSQDSANVYDLNALKHLSLDNISELDLRKEIEIRKAKCIISTAIKDTGSDEEAGDKAYDNALASISKKNKTRILDLNGLKDATHIPYNLLTQHSIPDKSIADCVESLIGAYLISCGTKSALLFMKWLDLKVMSDNVAELNQDVNDERWHWLPKIESPLVLSENIENYAHLNEQERQSYLNSKKKELDLIYFGSNLDKFEKEVLHYEFNDKSYLVQAFTHNSYYDNRITDCYQRLEFLGDAVLDFLITRYLFEDPAKHSPGTLTDLRSALVNNTFFASLAVKYDFQKYIKILSADLIRVITNFVNKVNKDESFINSSTFGLCIEEGESENLEDVQVPKALGDVFESVAGAIYLDSGLSLDTVWRVYFGMMRPEIEYFSKNVPKSPIRELLEMKPQNVKFSKPEMIKGKKVSVTVEVFSEGTFVGIGRNKRFAKSTAAKAALRALKAKIE